MVKNGLFLILIALLVAELCKILIYANFMTCGMTCIPTSMVYEV